MSSEGFLGDFLALAQDQPDRTFARFGKQRLTFAELLTQAGSVAAALRQRQIGPGERVAVMMENSPASLPVIFGLALAEVAWVPVNCRLKGPGLAYILEHAEPALLIADQPFESVLPEGHGLPVIWHDSSDPSLALTQILNEKSAFTEALPPATALFAIMYTSGTTGPPKGVQVTHAMMRFAGRAVALITQVKAGDCFSLWEPLYHIGGAQLLMLPLLEAATLSFDGTFSASRFWQRVKAAKASHMHYLGGVLQILLKQAPGPLDRDHGLRVAWGGGCPRDIWRAFEERFGLPIRECYGMTEASSVTTYNDDATLGSVGHAVPWLSVDLLDETGQAIPTGQRGEIVVRAKEEGALFNGYFRNPEATAKALRDGALWTGDIGSFDDQGRLYFHGRVSDSIRVGGENVSAWEVERVAARHPQIEDCAAIGVDSDIGEQDIKLFIKPRKGKELDFGTLSGWLSTQLASFQRPRYLTVIDEFPRTASQRIEKHKLSRETEGVWQRK